MVWLLTGALLFGVGLALRGERARRQAVDGFYAERSLADDSWDRAFPEAARRDVVDFLTHVVSEAFDVPRAQADRLRPSDRIDDLYRVHQGNFVADTLQLEALVMHMRDAYGVGAGRMEELSRIEELTLGDLFAMTRA